MGTASTEVSPALLERLKRPPLCDQLRIIKEAQTGDGYFYLMVESPALPPGYSGVQELILVDGGEMVLMKPWRDV
jgi:hypothetical protein